MTELPGMWIVSHCVPVWLSIEQRHVLKLGPAIQWSGGCYKIKQPLLFELLCAWMCGCVCLCVLLNNVVTRYFWQGKKKQTFKAMTVYVVCVCMSVAVRNQRQWLNVLKHRWSNSCCLLFLLSFFPHPPVSLLLFCVTTTLFFSLSCLKLHYSHKSCTENIQYFSMMKNKQY